MVLPRIHAFELEDQSWFPVVVRDLATDYLRFVAQRFKLHEPMVAVLAEALRATGSRQIVDLCSGGSGPLPDLVRSLARQGMDVRATLTDRFPNLEAFRQAGADSGGAIDFVETAVDARAVPRNLPGVRTLFNAFHHFRPDDARAILADAVAAGVPIAVFEISERRMKTLLPMLLTPLFVLVITPLITPFLWRRLLWTYLLPLVPLTCMWDGLVSQLRAYTVEELRQMAGDPACAGFEWRAGQEAVGSTPGQITYLVGWPSTTRMPSSM